MNTRKTLAVLLLLSLALVTGCASTPKSRPFNAAANAELKHIESLPMRKSELDVLIVNNPGYSFGLIGVLVAESHLAPRRAWLKGQVEATGFDHVETFRVALTEAMARHGYSLSWPQGAVESPRPKVARSMWGVRKSYPDPSDAQAQALLDVNFGFVGFASAGSGDGSPYRPTVVLTARLMDANGKSELFQEVIAHNAVFPGLKDQIVINPDPEHAYPDFDALKQAGPDAIDGLRAAFELVAARLAEQLRRR